MATPRQIKRRTFEYYQNKTLQHNENKCCSVIALSVVTGLSFEKAHYACRQIGGRVNGQGMYTYKTIRVLASLGFSVKRIPFNGKSMRTLTIPWGGQYLVTTHGHIIGISEGRVVDWSATTDRLIRPKEMYKVYRTHEPTFKPKHYVSKNNDIYN